LEIIIDLPIGFPINNIISREQSSSAYKSGPLLYADDVKYLETADRAGFPEASEDPCTAWHRRAGCANQWSRRFKSDRLVIIEILSAKSGILESPYTFKSLYYTYYLRAYKTATCAALTSFATHPYHMMRGMHLSVTAQLSMPSCPCFGGDDDERSKAYEVPKGVVPGQESMGNSLVGNTRDLQASLQGAAVEAAQGAAVEAMSSAGADVEFPPQKEDEDEKQVYSCVLVLYI